MNTETCKDTHVKIQISHMHAHIAIFTLALSHPAMAISIVCVDTYGIDFPWQCGPSIATNIGLQSHHVDTEHNHFCLSALLLWHNEKRQGLKDVRWDATHHL